MKPNLMQFTKDATSHYSHNEPWRSLQLPITHIKSSDEVHNLPLLLSRGLTKCTSNRIYGEIHSITFITKYTLSHNDHKSINNPMIIHNHDQ